MGSGYGSRALEKINEGAIMKIQRRLFQGQQFPFLYGVAWEENFGRVAICYPIPFNLVLRWLRDAWFVMAQPSKREWYTHKELERHVETQVSNAERYGRRRGAMEEKARVADLLGVALPTDLQRQVKEYLDNHFNGTPPRI